LRKIRDKKGALSSRIEVAEGEINGILDKAEKQKRTRLVSGGLKKMRPGQGNDIKKSGPEGGKRSA